MLELMPVRDVSFFDESEVQSVSATGSHIDENVSAQLRVLDALSDRSPRTIDDVARRAGLGVAETQSVLGMLGLEGTANVRERGWVKQSQKRA
jgi:predicted Rossmann fold nucleotide-binding protein DprA/Smf involved in DNA uptake